jgi:4-hydroxythreonine-4-phosphate dehydrogenase
MSPRIGVLLGDPNGIGPELVVKLLSQVELATANVLVIGGWLDFDNAQRLLDVKVRAVPLDRPEQVQTTAGPAFIRINSLQQEDITPCRPTAAAGAAVIRSLNLAVDLARRGAVDAICYAPLNKEALHLAGFQFPDELRFFAHELGHAGDAGEINVMGNAWTSRVTSHVPIGEVPHLITGASVRKAIRLIHDTMLKSGVDSPRIAVAALNPHAGDGGNFGREEIDIIRPAVLQAAADGIHADGPFPADTIFLKLRDGAYDGVVTMYHDQGQIAMKLMGFQRGVTVGGGLSIPITTPAHGTAFDIVGEGRADAGAMIEAFNLAVRMASRESGGKGGRL